MSKPKRLIRIGVVLAVAIASLVAVSSPAAASASARSSQNTAAQENSATAASDDVGTTATCSLQYIHPISVVWGYKITDRAGYIRARARVTNGAALHGCRVRICVAENISGTWQPLNCGDSIIDRNVAVYWSVGLGRPLDCDNTRNRYFRSYVRFTNSGVAELAPETRMC